MCIIKVYLVHTMGKISSAVPPRTDEDMLLFCNMCYIYINIERTENLKN